MGDERTCIARIDVPVRGGKDGDVDSVLVYISRHGVSMLVTCRYGGEAEVLLDETAGKALVAALERALASG